MKKSITFVRPSMKRTPGLRARCEEKHPRTNSPCVRLLDHPGACHWKVSPHGKTRARDVRESLETRARKKKVHLTPEARMTALEMIEDPMYRKRLLRDLRLRNVRPAVECMLWYYAKGKPKEMVEHSGTLSLQQELSALTDEQLRERALAVAGMLQAESGDSVATKH